MTIADAAAALLRRPRKETLTDVLDRRSRARELQQPERSAAIQFSLAALTRNASTNVAEVPLDQLHVSHARRFPRSHRQQLEQLAQSLAAEGQLEPVIARRVVRDDIPSLEIVTGARRLEAARICDATIRPFPTLKVDIRQLTDEEAERIALVDNLHRESLTAVEVGYRFWELLRRDPERWSVPALADFVHLRRSSVQTKLDSAKEPAIAEAVLGRKITNSAGRQIARLPASERQEYLRSAIARRLTAKQIQAEVDRRLAWLRACDEWSPSTGAALANRPTRSEVDGQIPEHQPSEPPAAVAARRAQLEAQYRQARTRIDELETSLRLERQALQVAEAELASMSAPVFAGP